MTNAGVNLIDPKPHKPIYDCGSTKNSMLPENIMNFVLFAIFSYNYQA